MDAAYIHYGVFMQLYVVRSVVYLSKKCVQAGRKTEGLEILTISLPNLVNPSALRWDPSYYSQPFGQDTSKPLDRVHFLQKLHAGQCNSPKQQKQHSQTVEAWPPYWPGLPASVVGSQPTGLWGPRSTPRSPDIKSVPDPGTHAYTCISNIAHHTGSI